MRCRCRSNIVAAVGTIDGMSASLAHDGAACNADGGVVVVGGGSVCMPCPPPPPAS